MSDRKPNAGFWIIVTLVAVFVGYPLSFGPACWVADWLHGRSEHAYYRDATVIAAAYRPAAKLVSLFTDNDVVWDTIVAYGEWGTCSGYSISVMSVAIAIQ